MEEDKNLTLIEHLEELRGAIIRSLVSVVILFPLGYWLSLPAMKGLKEMWPEMKELIYIHPLGFFFIRMKIGIGIAVLTGFPYIAWQLWQFIAPGLFHKERYYLARMVFISSFLFLAGSAFALFAIFPAVLRFSVEMSTADIIPRLEVSNVFNLALMMVIGFGVVFQLPVVVYFIARIGLVPADVMARNRPLIIVVIFIFAAFFTPPDVVSQLAMGLPALILFEISLLLARIGQKKGETED